MPLISGKIIDQITGLPIQGVEITEVLTALTISPQEIINKLKLKKIKSSLIESKLEKTWVIIIPTFDTSGFVTNLTITSPTQKGEDKTNIPGKVTIRTETLRNSLKSKFFEKDISSNVDIIVSFIAQKYPIYNNLPTSF
jgi:hypothetical protein